MKNTLLRYCKSAFTVLGLLFCLKSNAQLKASFTSDITRGCVPLVVKFTDASTGDPDKWKWDLGNGAISFLKNPSTTYFTPGKYTVRLIVQKGAAIDTITKVQYIDAQAQPNVDFSASKTSGCFPLQVHFTDLTTTPAANIASWKWDFGDGTLANVQNPDHTYINSGNFNISLQVQTSAGCIKSITKNNFIKVPEGVTAAFSNTQAAVCNPPFQVQFNNLSKGPGKLNYVWDFGDSSTSSATNPVHTYTAKGLYTVKLIATSSSGCTDTLIKSNAVDTRSVLANFSIPDAICQNSIVTFNNNSTPNGTTAKWIFSDSSVLTGDKVTKQFINPGTYRVTLIATLNGCSDTSNKSFLVHANPSAAFTTADSTSCKVPFTTTFQPNTNGLATYKWTFGDGDSSNLQTPTHTYLKADSFNVKLAVMDTFGCVDTIARNGLIRIASPKVVINNLPVSGCLPFKNNFSATVYSVDPVKKYTWDFGDNQSSSAQFPTHIYDTAGVFNVKLFIETNQGCKDSGVVNKGVAVGYRLNTQFSATPQQLCAFTPVDFTDLTKPAGKDSTGRPDQWLWIFGDGSSSTDRFPQHLYLDTGAFTVTLIAYNLGCPDTATYKNYIYIKPPVAKFDYTYNCGDKYTRQFQNHSEGADTWLWDFGDGNRSNQQNPIHQYAAPGDYQVILTVKNNSSACSNTLKQIIQIIDEKAAFTISEPKLCRGTADTLTTTNLNFAHLKNIYWDFGDNTGTGANSASITHVYNTSGNYSPTLIINDILNCSDTLSKPLAINVNGPVAGYKVNPVACANTDVQFSDASTTDPTQGLVKWEWSFGDNTNSSSKNAGITHQYTTGGNFDVALRVTDVNGCRDSITKQAVIHVSKPVALFNVETNSCTGASLVFNNMSKDTIVHNSWYFGDGRNDTSFSPVHKYMNEGRYTVSLKIKDNYGCIDSFTKNDVIIIANPIASYAVSDTFSNCPPLIVNFSNTSKNGIAYNWDFGDQNFSNLPNPSHFYANAGNFTATLKVSAAGGCVDSMKRQIIIKGPSGSFNYPFSGSCAPLVQKFTANAKNYSSILWDFNDGTTVSGPSESVTHRYAEAGTFLPKMILMDNTGCKVPVKGLDTINVFDIKALFDAHASLNCDAQQMSFNDLSVGNDAIIQYNWAFGDNTFDSVPNPLHTYTQTGNYNARMLVETAEGCTSTYDTTFHVELVSRPLINIASVNEACANSTVSFDAVLSNPNNHPVNWQWNLGNSDAATAQATSTIYKSAATYTVALIASRDQGCTDTITKQIVIHPLPDLNIAGSNVLCKGQTKLFTASGADQYLWSPASGLSCESCRNTMVYATNDIQYFLTGTTVFGCTAKDSISIRVAQPFTLSVSKNDSICSGNSVQLLAKGADNYQWSPSSGLNNSNVPDPVANPVATTLYNVVASDRDNCFKDTGFIKVTVFPVPQVSAGSSVTINAGKPVDLVPTLSPDITKVTWSPPIGVVKSIYPGIEVQPGQTTTYTINVANPGNCRAKDTVTVYVLCNDANVFIPNTFSPNGDGSNEIFYPRGSGLFTIKSLRIYNRNGQLVFQRTNMKPNESAQGWDGSFNGIKLSPDVFIYIAEIECSNGQPLLYKGNIALIK